MNGTIALIMAKRFAKKIGSRITGTSYSFDDGKITFNTMDGDYSVKVNNGLQQDDRDTLDALSVDGNNLKVNNKIVLTEDDSETDDINMDNWF